MITHLTLAFLLSALASAQTDPTRDPARPLASNDAFSPAETAARMVVPPGFTVQLISGEPDVVQPIAYTLDDRGRLWVLENSNYPECPGKPKDRVLVLE
ncbi:MAG: hypothetical protein RLZZ214_1309, partial [Verrucomicrobiota bacterium]